MLLDHFLDGSWRLARDGLEGFTRVRRLSCRWRTNTVRAMSRSDVELLVAIVAGDRAAFAVVYDRHAATVFGLLRTMLSGPGEAEDVLQETFLLAWRQSRRYNPDRSTALGWLVMMARSRALDRLRRRQFSSTSEVPDQPVLPQAGSVAGRDESAAAVRRALTELPCEQRAAIEPAFYGALTYQQVVDRQGVPVGTAKTRIWLGMINMRKLLKPMEGTA
jgi:RNA polymerase sigma-70 factor, ECF subfamily